METSYELTESTSRTLLQRVQAQDTLAWQRFVALYGPVVYRWVRKYGVRPQDVADVTQELFQAVFVSIGRFRSVSPNDSLRGWLWTITRNKICDYFRQLQDQPAPHGGTEGLRRLNDLPDIPDEAPEPLAVMTAELSHRAILLIQTEFEQKTWQAFWAIAVEGDSAAQAAEKLGLTVGAAYKAKSRVLNRLRQELAGLDD